MWALGSYDDVTGSIPTRKTLALHWNGTAWAQAANPDAGTGDNWFTEATAAPGGTIGASGVSAAGTPGRGVPRVERTRVAVNLDRCCVTGHTLGCR